MTTRKILVPVDASEQSTTALQFAVENYPEATIVALHVIDPSDFPASGFEAGTLTDFERFRESQKREAETLLENARERTSDTDVDVETAIETGPPARRIVAYADENDIDHIVIGSHGRTGASRILLGSVAESVTRRASVPVTIVR